MVPAKWQGGRVGVSEGYSPTLGCPEPAEGQHLQPEKQEPGTPAPGGVGS